MSSIPYRMYRRIANSSRNLRYAIVALIVAVFCMVAAVRHGIPILSSLTEGSCSDEAQLNPLIVIFTTADVRNHRPYHVLAHQLVIKNWASLMPVVQPVLFIEQLNSSLAYQAMEYGWDVLPITDANSFGAPKLRAMYRTITELYDSTFIGYCNGDILFEDSLIETMTFVYRNLEHFDHNVLVIGQRTNMAINDNWPNVVYDTVYLRNLTRGKNLFTVWGVDYFLFTRIGSSLNWTALADVVIGRRAFDNYIVSESIRSHVNSIDASGTLLAVHLSTPGNKKYEGAIKDNNYNAKLIPGSFPYGSGVTSSANLVTFRDFTNQISIKYRWQ